eukprot:TRINITY_DN84595_c0_g1_i1.p1 TRINITY_DN84595_c0_g1~~TRINITY_DN84595_c0_g1_i1.p1  ORF type:complete len:542 (-),score=62.50 TRINITY_DN84595_c0_g1_i1:56-1681(-)
MQTSASSTMACAGGNGQVFHSFASQLAAQRLKLRVPDLLIWEDRDVPSMTCPGCSLPVMVLLKNGCAHAFCEDCWVQRAESQLAYCKTQCRLYPPCLRCDEAVDARLWSCLCSHSATIAAHDNALRTELSRLVLATKAFSRSPQLDKAGPVCSSCQRHRTVLLQNACGHTACEWCWSEAAEKQLPRCRKERSMIALCFQEGCDCPMESCIWRHVCTNSTAVRDFSREATAELKRLGDKAANSLVRATEEWSPGPRCSLCGIQQLALLQNSPCHHTACESCWTRCAAKQIPACRTYRKLRPCCFAPSCDHAMSLAIFEQLRTVSEEVSKFGLDMDAEVKALTQTARDTLTWASTPCDSGPICSICDERCLALLKNKDCGHAACQHCWSSWIETQLPRCHDEKRPVLRCFGEKCQSAVVASIWSHACTRSESIRDLESLFVRRRQLQTNSLYPVALQVDCPREGCLGLGYRGFDTIMCFMCEHQWIADSGEPAATNMSELIGEELMKACPKCGAYIIKNGGCDHMTCRCKHEFYWTTLKPYRA